MSYVTVYSETEVDIDDVLDAMSTREKQQLVDDLYEDGYCPKELSSREYGVSDFDIEVSKLVGNSWRLSKEDEETILSITRKLI